MEELRRRLQAVVDTRFDGKARRASINAGLNPNQIGNMLGGATQLPDLYTLEKLCQAFEWRLEDAVYWALGKTAPSEPEPLVAIAQQLARLNIREQHRAVVMDVVRQYAETAGEGTEAQ